MNVTSSVLTKNFVPTSINYSGSAVTDNGVSDTFTFNVSAADSDLIIFVNNTTYVSGSNVDVVFKKGDFWAAKEMSATVSKGVCAAFKIDSAAVKKFDGTMEITLTPDESHSLAGINASVAVLEVIKTPNN